MFDLATADNDDGEGGSLTIHQAAEKGLHKDLVRCDAGTGSQCPGLPSSRPPPPNDTLLLLLDPTHKSIQDFGRMVERALDVDLEAMDSYGRTALMWAAELGHIETVDALLELGAERQTADTQRGR